MKLPKFITDIKVKTSFQGKRNRRALRCLADLGFPMAGIRRALLDLNGVTMTEIAGKEISLPTISNTIKDVRSNRQAQLLIAEKLYLPAEEIFPDSNTSQRAS